MINALVNGQIISINDIIISQNTFSNDVNIVSVDLNYRNCENNSIANLFYDCSNLTTVTNINENVTNMANTFYNCKSLIDAPIIGNNVVDISYAFAFCDNLVNVPVIGNNVTNMVNTFRNCFNLVNIPEIPENVTNMRSTFEYCTNLINVPVIPNSVTNMRGTFYNCDNLVNVLVIGSNVSDMVNAFRNCTNLVNAPVIPNSVTNMHSTFYNCHKLVNAPVIPNSVTNMDSTFGCCYNLVNIPNLSNATNLINMDSTFWYCVNLVNAPVIPNSVINMTYTFARCFNLVNAPEIPNSVTSMHETFENCTNLVNAPEIPNSVTNMYGTFYYCNNLINAPVIPNSVTDMPWTFAICTKLTGDIHILSENISNAYECFNYTNTSLQKNVYIPVLYQNGVNTTTYNTFKSMGYSIDERINGIQLFDPNASYIIFDIIPDLNTLKYLNGNIVVNNKKLALTNNEYVLYNENYPVVVGHVNNLSSGIEYTLTKDLTSVTGYTITLNVDQTGCDAEFDINGVKIPATVSGNLYTLTLNTDEEISVGYTVSKEGYSDAEGTVTFDNSNVTENITMEAASDIPWTRPDLTANGIMGGDSFAVSADVNPNKSTCYAWKAVNNSTAIREDEQWWSLQGASDKEYYFYNPKPLKVASLDIYCRSATARPSSASVYGSNDGSTWTLISSDYTYIGMVTYLGNRVYKGHLTVNSSALYKYHKIVMYPQNNSDICMRELAIEATQSA